jgi:hypothetical protein
MQAEFRLGSYPGMMTTASAGPFPATLGHRSEPDRVAFPYGSLGDPICASARGEQVRTASNRHTTLSAAVSLGLLGLRANERRCDGFTLVSRPEMGGTDESK